MEAATEVKSMNESIAYVGKYVRVGGFLGKDRWAQHVARLTDEQVFAINQIDPEILTNRRKFYWWLENIAGPTCDVRGKILTY